MKIEKNKLVKVTWKSKKFGESLCINDIDGLILNSITVFGKIPNDNYQEIPFQIECTKGKVIIYPRIYGTKFYVFGERIVNANVIEIKSEDYIRCSVTMGGSYEFVLKNDIEINL